MAAKIFRDPLYNYVSIDLSRDRWLLDVLNSKEVQRLRRIHQLGVSSFTYSGADHSRLNHSLGVAHLMQLAVDHLSRDHRDTQLQIACPVLLAAALTHDVGHGPFSHLFEPCLGIDHEEWTQKILLDSTCEVHQKLKSCDPALPDKVAKLIDPHDQEQPAWQKYLISSQLDVDRLDYLRRDSLFTGAGYGHFDWHRLITSIELEGSEPNQWEIVWNSKAKLAIEEYVFSRFYMYQNVYLHKTTRGFEQMLQAMWRYAKTLREKGVDVCLMPAIASFWNSTSPTTAQYLAIEEFTVLSQIQAWTEHSDPALSDIARRFLNRRPFAMIEPPVCDVSVDGSSDPWDEKLREIVAGNVRFQNTDLYCLVDAVKPKYHQPYFPERESDEQSVKNSIRVRSDGGEAVEISNLLPRMRPMTERLAPVVRYYIPHEMKDAAIALKNSWCS